MRSKVETQKDRSLRRRIQSLQCFLFEQLHRELSQLSLNSPPGIDPPAKAPLDAALPSVTAPGTAATPVQASAQPTASSDADTQQTDSQPSAAATESELPSSDASQVQEQASDSQAPGQQSAEVPGNLRPSDAQPDVGMQAAGPQGGAKPVGRKSVIDATFGLVVRQRTKVMTGLQADKLRESRSFQVVMSCLICLSYLPDLSVMPI